MSASLEIRSIREEDTDKLSALMKEYIVDFYKSPEPPDSDLSRLIGVLKEGKEGLQWVAETGGELVAFATLYFTYSTLRAKPVAVMNDLFVKEPWRGNGAGEALFQRCREYARSAGFAAMSWETSRENARARRFYERMGGTAGDWLSYSIEF